MHSKSDYWTDPSTAVGVSTVSGNFMIIQSVFILTFYSHKHCCYKTHRDGHAHAHAHAHNCKCTPTMIVWQNPVSFFFYVG